MRLFILILLFVQPMYGAFERISQGSRAVAMGGSLVAVSNNQFSAFSNPATLSFQSERTLAVSYAPQPFEIPELSQIAASFVEPSPFGVFSLSASRFGFSLYKETRVGVSYSNTVTDQFMVGATLNYYSLIIQNYGSAGSVGFDLGGAVELSEYVRWGFVAFNLHGATIGEAKEKLPQVFSTGVAYMPMSGATITASLMKDVRYEAELHIGIEYVLMDLVSVRAGSTSDPNTLNAGIGIQASFVQLDYAFSSHSELGISHQFSISLLLGKL
jgi:hypothetical protein